MATAPAMAAFAANSILCRLALGPPDIDAASFTAIRPVSGAGTSFGGHNRGVDWDRIPFSNSQIEGARIYVVVFLLPLKVLCRQVTGCDGHA